ncbi:SLAP domain-containing protein [Lactobacillus apis]|uniref:SLAP domain-containing protein n=1 Tax=Lactobacillus apis TaxID=303541 RepID=UPI0027421E01|nr:SLAP domain-containing protein [Lactobacillus apis]WLS85007.1 SLAP domain-containing protein [Lactobacillus apis]
MKKINKKLLTSIAGIVLLSIGFVSLSSESSSIASVQKVNAATTKVQLKSNAYVYTKQGVRKRVKSLKKGRILNAYSLVTIKGTKYYNIGKGRYIKKTNVQKNSSNTASSAFLIQLTKASPIYDANGRTTRNTFKKGLVIAVKGRKLINGGQFYALKGNKYISASDAIVLRETTPITPRNSNDKDNNQLEGAGSRRDKPTQAEIDYMLSNIKNINREMAYFSDSELSEIQTALWQKIQNYRSFNGYAPYKSNHELDTFIAKVSSTTDNMFLYSEDINNGDVAQYLPTLASKGMNAVQAIDHYKYYGNYRGAPAVFNIRDRNTEHVATDIFNSLKNDPYYESKILGLFDKKASGALELNYNWSGTSSTVGLVFI